jgi:NAD+ synthase
MVTNTKKFSYADLDLDAAAETGRIVQMIRHTLLGQFHRLGAVVGISGGVDSAVVLALCARALDPQRVLGVLLPEKESSTESESLARLLAQKFGARTVKEEISPALVGFDCYNRRDEAVKRLFPQYGPDWKIKIVLPGDLLNQGTLNVFYLVVNDPQGTEYRKRLPPTEFRQIMAASNFKQRSRMTMVYYHAELNNYAVMGTSNKNEHELGFFVKYGDGGADISPIEHLFKTQVFQLAHYLGVPEAICNRTPTTDTYPGAGSQEEFFYRIPFHLLDAIWLGFERSVACEDISKALGLDGDQVNRVIRDIISKQRTTAYLRAPVVRIDSALSE